MGRGNKDKGHRHRGRAIVSALFGRLVRLGQKEDINLRHFAPYRLLRVIARPNLRPVLERDEEAMMPCRVVAHVIREESLDERQLAGPQVRLINVGEEPLPVAPSMVVLRVCLEYLFVEC